MIVQLLASLWALRHHGTLAERLAAANGIAWTGLTLTMVTAGMIWAVFPPPYVSLPGPLWLVLIPAVEVAVACAAVNVALTLGFEVIVFAARAWHRPTASVAAEAVAVVRTVSSPTSAASEGLPSALESAYPSRIAAHDDRRSQ
jgi:hypothetical protein